jgi:transcriptional regulator with XRE-family HTH domain
MTADPARARAREPIREIADVGVHLRQRRLEKGISLRALARLIGISPSALSQIETGKSRPSVSTLYAIVTELGMSLDELFGGVGRRPPAPAPAGRTAPARRGRRTAPAELGEGEHVQRIETRSAIQLESGVRWERLTPAHDPAADFLYVVYEPGGSSSTDEHFMRHAGREYGIVLSGVLEVTIGIVTYQLRPGDSISFQSTKPHRLRNAGDVPAEAIWLVAGRGGREPRARRAVRTAPEPEGTR